jgi:hypothetical protein
MPERSIPGPRVVFPGHRLGCQIGATSVREAHSARHAPAEYHDGPRRRFCPTRSAACRSPMQSQPERKRRRQTSRRREPFNGLEDSQTGRHRAYRRKGRLASARSAHKNHRGAQRSPERARCCPTIRLRSSFRDWAGNETNFPREVAEQALAHAIGDKSEQAYRRGDALEKRRSLMDTWASFCWPAAGANVLLMRKLDGSFV